MNRWTMFAGIALLTSGLYKACTRAPRNLRAQEHAKDIQTWETEGGRPDGVETGRSCGPDGCPHWTSVPGGQDT
jgi:hypothetical protein